jgi:hypothetical protein
MKYISPENDIHRSLKMDETWLYCRLQDSYYRQDDWRYCSDKDKAASV